MMTSVHADSIVRADSGPLPAPIHADGKPIIGDYLEVFCPHCGEKCNCIIAEIDGHDHYCWSCHKGFQPTQATKAEAILV